MSSLAVQVVVCVAALMLDYCLGEPRRAHPLVFFGNQVNRVEAWLNRAAGGGVMAGAAGVLILVGPLMLAAAALVLWLPSPLLLAIEAIVLWLALSLRGLTEHARAVAQPLLAGDLPEARTQVGRIVSRNAQALDEPGVAAAATESVLENGADAVFASLFWYLLAGLPGVVLHRAINTLDAMWGYRNERFLKFGRVAARLDDLLNWIPARLTALSYLLAAGSAEGARRAWRCWRTQAAAWDSPNAGPVMAAGAGALGVRLGGPAPYAGGLKQRPFLGEGGQATADAINQAILLVRRGVWWWVLVLAAMATIQAMGRGL